MKRKLVTCASALFFLAIFNCKRDKPDPECRDASCCSPGYYTYIEYVTDLPAHLSGPPQFSTWGLDVPVPLPTGVPEPFNSRTLTICEKSLHKINGFTAEVTPVDRSKIIYNNRVSGKILRSLIPGIRGWIITIYIDKIEKIN